MRSETQPFTRKRVREIERKERKRDREDQMLGLATAGKQVPSNLSNEKQLVTKGFAYKPHLTLWNLNHV